MGVDLEFVSFITKDKAVGILSLGQATFSYYTQQKQYDEFKKQQRLQQQIFDTQASLKKTGIEFDTFLTRQTIKAQARDEDLALLKSGTQDLQRAASVGSTGSAAAIIAQNTAAKRLRASAEADVTKENITAKGQLALDAVNTNLDLQLEDLWSKSQTKPNIFNEAVGVTVDIYNEYRSELTLLRKMDAFKGASEFSGTQDILKQKEATTTTNITGIGEK